MKPDRNRLRLLVLAGGAIGTLLRLSAIELIQSAGAFPWGTLTANVAGSLGLGFLVGRSLSRSTSPARITFVGVGVMGALTTFGGVMVQVVALVEQGLPGTAVLYLLVSVSSCLAASLASLRLGAVR